MAQTEDDGRYRPESVVTTLRTIPTTRVPVTSVVPTAYPGWNQRRSWPYDRFEPRLDRFEPRLDRFDPRYDGARHDAAHYDPRYNTNYYNTNGIQLNVSCFFFNEFPVSAAKPYRPYDYRTIRLDEKIDAKGYRYV